MLNNKTYLKHQMNGSSNQLMLHL